MTTSNFHYRRAGKHIRKLKKQKHPQKMLVNMAINEVTAGMKDTLPKYMRTKSGDIINLHEALA